MTILQEFGAFEEKIKAELDEQLPLLVTTKLLMECVKAGMGREVAHQIIKKHSTITAPSGLFAAIGSEKEFPLSLEQMDRLIQNPSDFAGLSVEQTDKVKDMIKLQINGKLSKVELTDLR
jgi:adenylosuccinate lyase